MAEKQRLLLLPGLLCDDALWQFQREALADVADADVAVAARVLEHVCKVLAPVVEDEAP